MENFKENIISNIKNEILENPNIKIVNNNFMYDLNGFSAIISLDYKRTRSESKVLEFYSLDLSLYLKEFDLIIRPTKYRKPAPVNCFDRLFSSDIYEINFQNESAITELIKNQILNYISFIEENLSSIDKLIDYYKNSGRYNFFFEFILSLILIKNNRIEKGQELFISSYTDIGEYWQQQLKKAINQIDNNECFSFITSNQLKNIC